MPLPDPIQWDSYTDKYVCARCCLTGKLEIVQHSLVGECRAKGRRKKPKKKGKGTTY